MPTTDESDRQVRRVSRTTLPAGTRIEAAPARTTPLERLEESVRLMCETLFPATANCELFGPPAPLLSGRSLLRRNSYEN